MINPSKHLLRSFFFLTLSSCVTTAPHTPTPAPPTKTICAQLDGNQDLSKSRQELCACTKDPGACTPGGTVDLWAQRIDLAVRNFRTSDTTQSTCIEQTIASRTEHFYFALATACQKAKLFQREIPKPSPQTARCNVVEYMDENACLHLRACDQSHTPEPVCLAKLTTIHKAKLRQQSEASAVLLRPMRQYQTDRSLAPQPCLHATIGCNPEWYWLPSASPKQGAAKSDLITIDEQKTMLKKHGWSAVDRGTISPTEIQGCIVQRELETNMVVYANTDLCYMYRLSSREGPASLRMLPCPQILAEFWQIFCRQKIAK